MRREWRVRIEMHEDTDDRVLVWEKRLADIDGNTKLVKVIVEDAARMGVVEILKHHRLMTVGEE